MSGETPAQGRRSAGLIAALELALLSFAAGATALLDARFPLDAFKTAVAGYAFFASGTLAAMALLRRRLRPGSYLDGRDTALLDAWRAFNYLGMNNLFPFYQNGLIPSPLRKFFLRLLGARVGGGIVSIAGPVLDPYMVTLGESVMVGQDTVLRGGTFYAGALRLGEIRVGDGAVIGARSVVMPDVVVGRMAMVKAMSYVEEGTRIGDGEIWGGIPARKMGQVPAGDAAAPFGEGPYVLLCAATQTFILTAAGLGTWALSRRFGLDLFLGFAAFYVLQAAVAVALMWTVRALFPFREGVFDFAKDRWVCYRWNLFAFIGITNLFLHYQKDVIPPILRHVLTRFLGGRLRSRYYAAGGIVFDPFFVEVERGATVGYEALLLPHAVATGALHLKPVRVGADAAVGDRAVIMPGADLGAGSAIEPLSLVTSGTRVPPGESWGGVPARPRGAAPPVSVPPRTQAADILWTLAVEAAILGGSLSAAALAYQARPHSAFTSLVIFYGAWVALSLAAAKALRTLFPITEGEFTQEGDPARFRVWRLHAFLCVTNLFLHYQNAVLPPALRRGFLRLLGARADRWGYATLASSVVAEPYLVTLGRDALLGEESLVTAMDLRGGRLVLKRVTVGRGAMVGDRAVVRPGAVIGEGARVLPLSLVEEDARIPDYEIWAGVPARKVGERPRPTGTTEAARL